MLLRIGVKTLSSKVRGMGFELERIRTDTIDLLVHLINALSKDTAENASIYEIIMGFLRALGYISPNIIVDEHGFAIPVITRGGKELLLIYYIPQYQSWVYRFTKPEENEASLKPLFEVV